MDQRVLVVGHGGKVAADRFDFCWNLNRCRRYDEVVELGTTTGLARKDRWHSEEQSLTSDLLHPIDRGDIAGSNPA